MKNINNLMTELTENFKKYIEDTEKLMVPFAALKDLELHVPATEYGQILKQAGPGEIDYLTNVAEIPPVTRIIIEIAP